MRKKMEESDDGDAAAAVKSLARPTAGIDPNALSGSPDNPEQRKRESAGRMWMYVRAPSMTQAESLIRSISLNVASGIQSRQLSVAL
jgi:hypothetical protein